MFIFWTIIVAILLAYAASRLSFSAAESPQARVKSCQLPISVNYHFTRQCNKSCGFCFHTATTSHRESVAAAMTGLRLLKDAGMKKINFAGGEPFLHAKFLGTLVDYCKRDLRLESVSIVTNGSLVTMRFLQTHGYNIDILAVSCDSFDEQTNIDIGRGSGDQVTQLRKIAGWCQTFGIKFKLNTVVCRLNIAEDMNAHVAALQPFRWKCFQVLMVAGENDSSQTLRDARKFTISDHEFEEFCRRHEHHTSFVPENNQLMAKSYLILDEYMRFLDRDGRQPSPSILHVGVEKALDGIFWDRSSFLRRVNVAQGDCQTYTPNLHSRLFHSTTGARDDVLHHSNITNIFPPTFSLQASDVAAMQGVNYMVPGQEVDLEAESAASGDNNSIFGIPSANLSDEILTASQSVPTVDPQFMSLNANDSNSLSSRTHPEPRLGSNGVQAQVISSTSSAHRRPLKRLHQSSSLRKLDTGNGSCHTRSPQQQSMMTDSQRRRQLARLSNMVSPSKSCFSIVSTSAMASLKSLISALRASDEFDGEFNMQGLSAVSRAIDRLEVTQSSQAIRRRFLLCRFADSRDQLSKTIQEHRLTGSTPSRPSGIRTIESEVKDLIVQQIYPHTIKQKYKAQAAKNWKEATRKFQLGILVLIPSLGKSGWQDYKYETLRDHERKSLFAAIEKQDDGYWIKASKLLTPFVQAMYDCKEYLDTLQIEMAEPDVFENIDCDSALRLLQGVHNHRTRAATP